MATLSGALETASQAAPCSPRPLEAEALVSAATSSAGNVHHHQKIRANDDDENDDEEEQKEEAKQANSHLAPAFR